MVLSNQLSSDLNKLAVIRGDTVPPARRGLVYNMKSRVLAINWHDQEPVYSLDFQCNHILATAGGDKEVRVSIASLEEQLVES